MFSRAFDLLFLTRPFLWIPMWAFWGLGYYGGCIHADSPSVPFAFDLPSGSPVQAIVCWLAAKPWFLLLCFTSATAGTYVLNQIGDVEVDRRNPGLRLLAHGIVGMRSAQWTAFLLFAGSLSCAWFLNRVAFVACLAAMILGILYSLPPFRFSGKPFLDFVSNGLGYGVVTFAMGWISSGNAHYRQMLLHAVPYFLLMSAGSIASTIPDMEGDRVDGKTTTSVLLGIRGSAAIALASLVGAGLAGFFLQDWIVVLCAVFSLFFFLRLTVKPLRQYSFSAYQVAGAFLVLFAMVVCVPLFGLYLFIFIATRTYFRLRHGIVYPKLGK